MTNQDEARVIADRLEAAVDLSLAELGDEYYYQSLPLCVIDAVWSIGVRYEGVRNVVERYAKRAATPRLRVDRGAVPDRRDQQSVSRFVSMIEPLSADLLASAAFFDNRQRTSTKSGILKADAVARFARVLNNHGIDHFQDIPRAMDSEALRADITRVPGQTSGVSLRYFFMLAGADDHIKPDRMILRFLAKCLGRGCGADEAARLLTDAAALLRATHLEMTPRLLDHEIWKLERAVNAASDAA